MVHMDNESDRERFASDDPRDPSYVPSDDDWVTDEEVQALREEREVFSLDETQQAEKIFKENLPAVAHSVVKLARTAQSEAVRLNAAKYVVDRNLGKIVEPDLGEQDMIKELLQGVVRAES